MSKKFDVCKWGREKFAMVNEGIITMGELVKAIPPQSEFNDWGVLGCFCEKNMEQTLALKREDYQRYAIYVMERIINGNFTPTIIECVGHIAHKQFENAIWLDDYFKTKNFLFSDSCLDAWLATWPGREREFYLMLMGANDFHAGYFPDEAKHQRKLIIRHKIMTAQRLRNNKYLPKSNHE